MADAALRLKPSPNSAAVWKPEGDGDGLTEVEATEPPPPRVTDTYQAASTTPVVAAAIRAAELAARPKVCPRFVSGPTHTLVDA